MIEEGSFEFNVINKIANEHCHKTFAFLDEDDLRNEIWVICLEKIDDFEEDRGKLEHFLRVTVKNRLINKFKDIAKTVKSPCPKCEYYKHGQSPDCAAFGYEKNNCDKYRTYALSIESRNSLLLNSDRINESLHDENIINKMMLSEVKQKIYDNISDRNRKTLDDLLSGAKISKNRLKRLHYEVSSIVGSVD